MENLSKLNLQGQDSLANLIASLPEQKRNKLIDELSDNECSAILYDWKFWARKEQLQSETDWFVWLLMAGRGAGKTRTGAEWVLERIRNGFRNIALVSQTKADARDTMVEFGDSSILKISPPWDMPHYEPSKRRLTWNNGAIAIIYSGDEPDQLRGPQHDSAWVDELAKFKYPKETWDNLEMGLRIGSKPQVVVTTTPRPIPIIRKLIKDSKTFVTRGTTYDNKANLSPDFIKRVLDKYEGTRLGRQELKGEVLEDTIGALWTLDIIDKLRVKEYPQLVRIVVAIDPAVTSNEDSNETGIIVAGISKEKHGYILFDGSFIASPNDWATRAISQYKTYEADMIIGETNNGGEMIENTIRMISPNVSYKGIHASRGKLVRAEPVSALYEQGKIHHFGTFPELEDQMCHWIPGEDSPDRMDALVWAITELLIEDNIPTPYENLDETKMDLTSDGDIF